MQQGPDYGNYGRHPEPGDETYGSRGPSPEYETRGMMRPSGSVSPQDEKTWSILSHLSVLVWPVIGFLPVAPLVIWLVYRDRSPRIAFHALQSLWYQVAWIVILVLGWSITFILSLVLIGFLLIPFMLLASVVPFIHGCWAAYKISQGVDYRYPLIADRIDGGRRNAH
ncbi:Tic20-like protein [Rubrobacter radiotolerans]|uniref:DUF4870 domain-containing protein n=1 Tax=Rubrobacter radiotolerans TaxID=42256 RepID=A0A023X6F6_RUBRA|nr:DUF4870 domain-containing protein [Rubrobacter radiotolerans]AHY47811.1 Tic20-like protein [Rubrobacter radiotolerans]MDX5892450.1 DUF4870 domain-containing protein [Rubrobacter radiotolerans]SMC07741.1 hypothetical protein SAMN00767673_2601 [Rubrobacter radiotolerans DSM 5868]